MEKKIVKEEIIKEIKRLAYININSIMMIKGFNL